MIRWLELLVSAPDFLGGERGWRLNPLPMANELINHAYVMSLKKIQRDGFGEPLAW